MSAAPVDANRLRKAWAAFRLVLDDYHWVTKLTGVFILGCCLLGSVVAYRGAGLLQNVAWVRLERVLVSDSFRMFLTLVFGLLVAIAIKRRQVEGRLDGDEHYNIGRALAFGYFKNFLVGALCLAREKDKKLHVFHPANVAQLRRFQAEVWPRIEARFKPEPIDTRLVAADESKPLTRRIIVVTGVDDGALWFDFPTTLFTIGDYYASWNRWLADNGRPHIDALQQREIEQTQIKDFFRHLALLGQQGTGLDAVPEYGLTRQGLRNLFEHQLEQVSLEQLERMLPGH